MSDDEDEAERFDLIVPDFTEDGFLFLLTGLGHIQMEAMQHKDLRSTAEAYYAMVQIGASAPDRVRDVLGNEGVMTLGMDDEGFVDWLEEQDPADPDISVEEIMEDIGSSIAQAQQEKILEQMVEDDDGGSRGFH